MTYTPELNIRLATTQDLPEILNIYNQQIISGTAVWHEQPFSEAAFTEKYQTLTQAGFPFFVAEDQGKKCIAGFADYSPFRAFSGYRYTVEHSVYIQSDYQGRGLATQLMQQLIQHAVKHNVHMMVAAIDAENKASIALHEKLGFSQTGYMPQVGYKFGTWRDLLLMQLQVSQLKNAKD